MILADFRFGSTVARYLQDDRDGTVGLLLLPESRAGALAVPRASLRGQPYIDAMPGHDEWPARAVDFLAPIKVAGEAYTPGFAQGHTMLASPTQQGFQLSALEEVPSVGEERTVRTQLERADGLRIEHTVTGSRTASTGLRVSVAVTNGTQRSLDLEMLGSFALTGITPFSAEAAIDRLFAHRFRSVWSAEGRHERVSIEKLHLERSWSGAGAFSERFGQVGSMPVRKWFPFLALEDAEAGVFWGAQLEWAGSWQMEIFRQHDQICLAGGLADREFGHWMKRLQPGERFEAPPAIIACSDGGFDELCEMLAGAGENGSGACREHGLPIVFNEWCTTWGEPTHDRLLRLSDRLKGTPVRYLVIDAGWYKVDGGSWNSGHGDWIPNPRLFPGGIAATAQTIRERGLIPGLWFELETVGSTSDAFYRTDLLLHRDGVPITVRERRFWDFRKQATFDYLDERVIALLREGGFGYLKIDYNETIGLGVDDAISLGEGLREHIVGVQRFLQRIREALPELVIENCSSGGHRLEPSMLYATEMSSFSDAHELVEIPIIAANLHRLMSPSRSQIWAVLHCADSRRRIVYSLAATFLGRMCLSGEYDTMSEAQRAVVGEAMELYEKAATLIRSGRSRRFGEWSDSWRRPRGWQAVARSALDESSCLVVAHFFENCPRTVAIPLPPTDLRIAASFGDGECRLAATPTPGVEVTSAGDFSAMVILLCSV